MSLEHIFFKKSFHTLDFFIISQTNRCMPVAFLLLFFIFPVYKKTIFSLAVKISDNLPPICPLHSFIPVCCYHGNQIKFTSTCTWYVIIWSIQCIHSMLFLNFGHYFTRSQNWWSWSFYMITSHTCTRDALHQRLKGIFKVGARGNHDVLIRPLRIGLWTYNFAHVSILRVPAPHL